MKNFHTLRQGYYTTSTTTLTALFCADIAFEADVQPGRNSKHEDRDGPLKVPGIRAAGLVQD